MSGRVIHLDVLVYKKGKRFIAHCLQLDIVASASTLEQARCDIEDLIKAHTLYTIENDDWDHFFKPAPSEIWAMLPKASSEEQMKETEPFQEIPPSLTYQIQRWQALDNLRSN